jgi:hypothetical protein
VFGLRVPFHVATKAINNDQQAHAHVFDVSRPLLYGLSGGVNQKIETCFAIHLHWFFS